jgi:hypothetical protein
LEQQQQQKKKKEENGKIFRSVFHSEKSIKQTTTTATLLSCYRISWAACLRSKKSYRFNRKVFEEQQFSTKRCIKQTRMKQLLIDNPQWINQNWVARHKNREKKTRSHETVRTKRQFSSSSS